MTDPFKQSAIRSIARIERIPLLGGLIPVLFLIIPSIAFMRHQSLWVDETTQLSGLTLGPLELLKWTTNTIKAFNVPGDASPPISYWLGQVWSALFGLSEISMRIFALVMVCLAVLVIYETGKTAFGFKCGIIAALLFALSPNIVEHSINIRNYPVFLLTSSLAFYFFIRILEDPARKNTNWLIGLSISSLLAIYTHFFGVLLTGSLFLAVFIGAWKAKGSLRPVLISMFFTGVGSLGLIPFLLSATKMLGQYLIVSNDGYLFSIVRLVYRQICHPAMSVSFPFLLIALMGVTFLAVILLILLIKDRSIHRRALFISLISGFVIILIGRFTISPLMTQPHYNLWIQPGLFVFLASAIAAKEKKLIIAGAIGVLMVILSFIYADQQLMINGKNFSHTRYSDIKKLVNTIDHKDITLVHTGGWSGAVYFPFLYEYGDTLKHYFFQDNGGEESYLTKPPHLDTKYDLNSIDTKFLIVLNTERKSAKDLAIHLHGREERLSIGTFVSKMSNLPGWNLIIFKSYVSFGQTDVSIFQRAE